MISLRKTVFTDNALTQFQQSVEDAITQVNQNQILNGTLLTGVALTAASPTSVNHKLGRLPLGYIVVSNSAGALVWNGAFTSTSIPLQTSADCTVSLWVF